MKSPKFSPLRAVAANWPVATAIAAWCFLCRYWLCSRFGFYEDDYWRIPRALSTPLTRIPVVFGDQISHSNQGRPLHYLFITALASVGGSLHGLLGAYWIGYAISVLNAWLLFTLLRRAGAGQAISAAAAAAFAVYPGDASQALLTHSLGVQPALTLVLIGMHLWLCGHRVASWATVFLALLCYETPVPLFAAVPLFLPRWNIRQLLRHASVLFVGIIAVAFLREILGESRVAGLHPLDAGRDTARNLAVGPFVSLSSFVWRPVEMASALDTSAVVLGLVAAFLGLALFLWCDLADSVPLPRLAAAGLTCLVLSYLLPVILDAADLDGRPSRVHFAALVGCAILIACLFGFLAKRCGRFCAASAMALLLGTSTAAGVSIQRDSERSWRLQREFWQNVVRLCPDLAPGKVVFVDGFRALPEVRHLQVFQWTMAMILGEIYQFPDGEETLPRLFLTTPDWRDHLEPDGGIVIRQDVNVVWTWYGVPPPRYDRRQFIVLEVRNGRLVRSDAPGPAVKFPEGPLYKYLLAP